MRLFHDFWKNATAIVRGRNILWLGIAIALTALSVYSGFDWGYFTALKGTLTYAVFFPAVVIGGLVPLVVPVVTLALGWMRKRTDVVIEGWAIGQAALLGSLISSLLKVFTGRIPPPMDLIQGALDMSHGFRFGFWEGGIFWGWPSSHTTIAFAMAVTMILLHPRDKRCLWASLAYAFYIGIGISMSIHWFSEFVAGAIVGTVIGVAVGKSFAALKRG